MLKEHQIYTNSNKFEFYKKQVQYLGHIILEDRITVDSEKVKEIMDWPMLTDVFEVRYFMGITCYYHRFIERALGFRKSYHTLQKKGTKFIWSQKFSPRTS